MRSSLRLCIALFFCANFSLNAQEQHTIEFNHLFDGTFTPKGIQNIRWMNDG